MILNSFSQTNCAFEIHGSHAIDNAHGGAIHVAIVGDAAERVFGKFRMNVAQNVSNVLVMPHLLIRLRFGRHLQRRFRFNACELCREVTCAKPAHS